MSREVSNSDDIIESRDVIERIADLESDIDKTVDEQDELDALKALAEQGEDSVADWQYGETLIRESYFEQYAQELAEDICSSPEMRDMADTWPYSYIDWGRAANALLMDYTSLDFDGVTYYAR